ncbi:MAG: hypothetical protein H5T73_03220 [Actinobacteria bacterium]|nr:hypothetical protein [Actinomycetota bacterium]
MTDGVVEAVLPGGDVTYIAGDFSYVGPNNGHGAPIDIASSTPLSPFPEVNGAVYAAVSDGSGGWYIGGNFTRVGGSARNCLAHIAAGGGVSSFDPSPNGWVSSLALSGDGSTLYAGGDFTRIGGEDRERIATLDTSTGHATPFDPGADDWVWALALSGDGAVLYAGGYFNSIGGQSCKHLAALDTSTGRAVTFVSGTDDRVRSLSLSGSTLYLGGEFTTVAGEAHRKFAVFRGLYDVKAVVASGQGALEPAVQVLQAGGDAALTAAPAAGWRLASLVDNGQAKQVKPGGMTYTIRDVNEDHLVEATFEPDTAPVSRTWYLAEGCTQGDFETWVLVLNPNPEEVRVDFDFMTSQGERAGPHGFPLPGLSRCSLRLNDFVTDWHVSTRVSATGEVVCERAMYGAARDWAHSSVGVTSPAATWYLAEGCTQGDFETWVLVLNPNPEEVRVDFDFMTSQGERAGPHGFPLPGLSRCSLRLNDFVTDWHVSTRVSATGEVVCERAMYGAARDWAHSSVGFAP